MAIYYRPALAFVLALLASSCGPAGLQRQDQFAWALNDAGSSSPAIVRVRILEAGNEAGSIRCLFSETLIDALMTEMDLPKTENGYRRALSFALAKRDHTFRFVRPASKEIIRPMPGIMNAGLSKGCEMIGHGKSALWADMQATVVEGPHFPIANGTR